MAVAVMPSPELHFGPRLGSENLAQFVARSAVDNMEFVLSDLQGIMGDIQSLVSHIDSVMCRSGRRARRERRQEAKDQQAQRENEEREHGAESNPSQAAEQKAPDPGGSSKRVGVKSQHGTNKALGINFSKNSPKHSSIEETNLNKTSEEEFSNRKNAPKKMKMPKRFSDSVLQEATNLTSYESFANASHKNKMIKKRSSEMFSPHNTIVDLEHGESPVLNDKPQKQRRTGVIPTRHMDLDIAPSPEILTTQGQDSNFEPWVFLDYSATRRPIYTKHGDSLASRGEYDLETQEARLGNRGDFSDGDQSHLSLEDSPLRLRYFNKTKKDEISPRGSVAIVYPIVKANSAELETKEKISDSPFDIDYYGRQRVCKAAFSPKQFHKATMDEQVQTIATDYEVPVTDACKGKGLTRGYRQSYVINKAFVPVTPTEQSSLSTFRKSTGPWNISDFQKQVHTETFILPNQEPSQCGDGWTHSSLPNSPKVKRSTAQRVGFDFEAFDSNQNRLHSRPVYARIEGSPASTRSSCSTVKKPVAHHYYYSIDSDMDSDIIPEYLDPRGLTPDIDLSYLNLIGGDVFNCMVLTESKATYLSEYEMPINLLPDHQGFETSEQNPANMTVVPFYHVLASKHSSTPSSSSAGGKENNSGEELTSPLLTCTGSNDTGVYCGCYESNLDSILENVAGFETFEAAVESLDGDDILHETYVNFDDQFEEDDWDIGLESGGVCEFSFDYPIMYLETSNDAGYSDFFSEKSFDISSIPSSKSLKRPCALSLAKRSVSDVSNIVINKTETLRNEQHDHSCQTNLKNELVESEEKRLGPSMDNKANYLRFHSRDHQSTSKTSSTKCSLDSLTEDDCPQLMSISYDTSCRAVASDSPMSLCSSEEAEFSPVSDRLITSSEGDDLVTSHDESYFLPSPDSSDPNAVDNARASRALGRTKARELTQQFLMSLRDIYERHNVAGGATSLTVHYDIPYNNSSRDSSSSGLSSENGSTITASTSTATDVTLTDDNAADDNDHDNDQQNTGLDQCNTNTLRSESQSSSLNEEILVSSGYNRNVNTWTAYAVVHVQADDVSDGTASDAMYNDNMVGSMYSMTASQFNNENSDVL